MQGVEIWSKINESAKLIAWPGVVTLGLIMFRARLGDLFQRLREAATPAGTMKFDPGGQAAIAATAGNLLETVRAEIEVASQAPTGENSDEEPSVRPSLDMQEVKGDVEAVIRASFAAGFEAAHNVNERGTRLKRGRSPRPMINWEGSTPEVSGYSIWGPDVETPGLGIIDLFVARDQRKEVRRQLAADHERIHELRVLIDASERDGDLAQPLREELAEALGNLAYRTDKAHDLDVRIKALEAKHCSGTPD